VGSAYIASIGNCLYSVIAGLAVWGTLGYMATSQGVPVSEVIQQSIGLAFVAYPQAISMIPSFSKLFGIMFFSILVFAGLSSSISILEAFSSAIMDKFHYPRKIVVSIVCFIGFLGGIIFTTGAGLYWLDIVDHFITTYGLVIVGILECLVVGWYLKPEKVREHINSVSTLMVNKWWDISIRVVIPLILGIILVSSLFQEFSAPYGDYAVKWLILIGRDWVFATLIIAFIITKYEWRVRSTE
jgi:NSS family neurotransmitter:Na+ symporter